MWNIPICQKSDWNCLSKDLRGCWVRIWRWSYWICFIGTGVSSPSSSSQAHSNGSIFSPYWVFVAAIVYFLSRYRSTYYACGLSVLAWMVRNEWGAPPYRQGQLQPRYQIINNHTSFCLICLNLAANVCKSSDLSKILQNCNLRWLKAEVMSHLL